MLPKFTIYEFVDDKIMAVGEVSWIEDIVESGKDMPKT